jgi:hypothetical protein
MARAGASHNPAAEHPGCSCLGDEPDPGGRRRRFVRRSHRARRSHRCSQRGVDRPAAARRDPAPARRAFRALTPALVATWALAGLYLSLRPSLVVVLLGSHSHIVGGLVPATLCATTALASILSTWSARRAVVFGTLALAGGVLVSFAGIRAASSTLLFAGSANRGARLRPCVRGELPDPRPARGADGSRRAAGRRLRRQLLSV